MMHIQTPIDIRKPASPPAIERLSSGLFQEVIITNTVHLKEKNFPQLTILSVANLLGETI
jgi:ribose-phosphate pyrophosphokinase